MKYKHIGEALNEIWGEVIGEENMIAEDLSNIVEIGKTIVASTQFNDNFDTYTKKLVDKVGKIWFRENSITTNHLPIMKESWEFGSIAEKVRVDYPEVEEDNSFDVEALADYDGEDVFTLSLPKVSAKFFNNSTTFKCKVSLPKVQGKSAWNSPREMSRFISLIENTIKQKLALDLQNLEYRTMMNLIAEKFKSNNGNSLINLLELYTTETGDTSVTTPAEFLTNPECLKFANKKIKLIRSLLEKPSKLYGEGGYVNTTSKSEQTLILLTDFDSALSTYLYSDTYHENYVTLDNYSIVPYWQSGGTDDSYENRSTIKAIPASEGEFKPDEEGEDTRTVIEQSNILGVLFDYRAAAVTCEHSDTESMNIPDVRYVNYWFFEDANYLNDVDENVVVFYLA